MMAHELWVVKGATMTNITMMTGSINWRSNVDELGDEISFDLVTNPRYFPRSPVALGDLVILKNSNEEITRAVVVDENKAEESVSHTAFDYAFYLNKSNVVYQFKKMRADECIKKICRDFNVPVGYIVPIPTIITKIYNDVLVSDIIRDILDMARQARRTKYLLEMRKGRLHIEPQGDLLITAQFQMYREGIVYDATQAITSPSKRRSITDMVNTIQIIDNEDKLVLTRSDTPMLNKYGRLQKVVQLDQEEKRSAAQVAQAELNALSKITEETSIELPGDDRVRAGRLIKVEEPVTGISGTYLIQNVNHTISGGVHRMSLGLEAR